MNKPKSGRSSTLWLVKKKDKAESWLLLRCIPTSVDCPYTRCSFLDVITFSAGSGRVTPSSTLKSIGAGGGSGATGTVSVPMPSASLAAADLGLSGLPEGDVEVSSFVLDR